MAAAPAPGTTAEASAKSMVAEQISQAVQSTSNLLQLMLLSSPSQAQLIKLPKSLLAKTCTINNTKQILEQLPEVISSLDAHMDNGLQSLPPLETVTQLLENKKSCQLTRLDRAPLSAQELELTECSSQAA